MTQVEIYAKAQTDPSFRKQELDDAHYLRKLALVVGLVSVVGWAGYAAYCHFAQSRWPDDGGVALSLILCASLYAHARTKAGALQAMDQMQPGQSPPPTQSPGARH